jgi:uncharacterized protein (TIRG00374 family)
MGPASAAENDLPSGVPDLGAHRRAWAVTALLAFVVLFGLAVYGDASRLVEALESFDLRFLPAIVASTLLAYGFRFAKWETYLRMLDVRMELARSATVFFSGLMGSITPGKVGETWKAWLAREAKGVSIPTTLPAIAAERVTDVIALAGLALLGLGVAGVPTTILVGVFAVFALGIGVIRYRPLCRRILARVERWPLVGGFAEELETIYEGSFELFAGRPLAIGLGLSVLAWGLEGLALWAALAGFGVDVGGLVPFFAFGAGSLLGALSMLPGGLGAAEAGMVGILVGAGVGQANAVAATLVVRAGTLWFGAALGAGVFSTSGHRLGGDPRDGHRRARFDPELIRTASPDRRRGRGGSPGRQSSARTPGTSPVGRASSPGRSRPARAGRRPPAGGRRIGSGRARSRRLARPRRRATGPWPAPRRPRG